MKTKMQKCCSAPNTHVFFQSVRRTEQLIVEGDQLFFRKLKLLIINRLELLFEIDNGARIGDVMVRLREMSKCYDLCVVFTMVIRLIYSSSFLFFPNMELKLFS